MPYHPAKLCANCGKTFYQTGRLCFQCRKLGIVLPRQVKPSARDLDSLWRQIQERGLMRKCELATLAGVSVSNVDSLMTTLEAQGMLLSQDDQGRVAAFRRVSVE